MKQNAQEEELITIKLKSFEDQAASKFNNADQNKLIDWFVKYALQTNLPSVPRISQFQAIDSILNRNKQKTEKLFKDERVVCGLLQNSKQIYDLAFINQKYQQNKIASTVDSKQVINRLQKYFSQFMDRNQDTDAILFIQNLNLFISMKQAFPKQNSSLLSNPFFQRQKLQVIKCYEFLLKPLFQKKNLKKYNTRLYGLVSWLVLMGDSRLDLAYDLGKKINSYVIYNKSEDSIEMICVCNALFDLLCIKFTRQTKLKHQNLAALLSKLESVSKMGEFFTIWIQSRIKFLDTLDFQNLFRVLTNLGFSNFVLQFLIKLWDSVVNIRKFTILLHVFSRYIRKQFIKLTMRNSDEFIKYFKIIKHFMIGLSNRQRFQGEQIDELTNNICQHAIKRQVSIAQCYKHIVQIYSTYENRFSCLSESSKCFFNEIQSLSNIKLQTADIHNIYDQYVIRDLAMDQVDNEWQSLRRTSNRYRGLENLGNTCYINAFLQALFMTKKFRMLIHNFTQDGLLPTTKSKLYALQYVFEELSRKQFNTLQPLRPDYFRMELPQPFKTSYTQQDSAEFGRIYLEQLSKQLEGTYLQRIQKLLVQKLTKVIRCMKCQNEKKQEQSLFDLILTVEHEERTICCSRLIKNYFDPVKFTNQDKLECDKCKMRTDSISQLAPQRFSDFLVLTLSIFQYVGQGKKILKPLTFEFTLNLGVILNNAQLGQYELYAFIVHMGSLQGSGHYVCYARNLQQNPTIWYNLNDGYVEQLQIGKPQQFNFSDNESPYMLFYSKKSMSVSRIVKSSMNE